jgi:hypothetical protein
VIGMFACRRRPAPVLMGALLALLVLLPASARAAEAPYFTSPPLLSGAAVVGSTLRVVPSWTGDPTPTATYRWGRCPPTGRTCAVIGGQTAATYVVTSADIGYRIAAEVTLANAVAKLTPVPTSPTAVVVAAPPPDQPPAPGAAPGSTPTTTPSPGASTVTLSNSAPSLAPAATFLRPFPVIRIRGFFARRGARITLLSIRGPRSAKVDIRCRGRGCPVRRLSLPTADTRVHRFERFLPAGILLQIRVTRPGRIGAYTSFLIRSRKVPLRTDRCLSQRSGKPIPCSAP